MLTIFLLLRNNSKTLFMTRKLSFNPRILSFVLGSLSFHIRKLSLFISHLSFYLRKLSLNTGIDDF